MNKYFLWDSITLKHSTMADIVYFFFISPIRVLCKVLYSCPKFYNYTNRGSQRGGGQETMPFLGSWQNIWNFLLFIGGKISIFFRATPPPPPPQLEYPVHGPNKFRFSVIKNHTWNRRVSLEKLWLLSGEKVVCAVCGARREEPATLQVNWPGAPA